jgi:hypothetical protein
VSWSQALQGASHSQTGQSLLSTSIQALAAEETVEAIEADTRWQVSDSAIKQVPLTKATTVKALTFVGPLRQHAKTVEHCTLP